jgi:hypothetical protein
VGGKERPAQPGFWMIASTSSREKARSVSVRLRPRDIRPFYDHDYVIPSHRQIPVTLPVEYQVPGSVGRLPAPESLPEFDEIPTRASFGAVSPHSHGLTMRGGLRTRRRDPPHRGRDR